LFHRRGKGPFPERSIPRRTSRGLDPPPERRGSPSEVGGNPHPSEPLSFAPRRGDPWALSDPGGSSHEVPFPSARRQAVMGRHGSGQWNGPIPFRMEKQDRSPASPTEHIASQEDSPEGSSSLSPLTPGQRIPIRTHGPLERALVSLKPCDSIVERTFPAFGDLLNTRDFWSFRSDFGSLDAQARRSERTGLCFN
jgi:hypothetical protein